MFGIGGGELILIAIVVLLAVGPNQMPKMIRTVGKGLREVRRATRELQSTVGVDELLRDPDLKVDKSDPLGLSKVGAAKAKPAAKGAPTRAALADEALAREMPVVGVDLELAYARAAATQAEQAAKAVDAADGAHAPPGPEPVG